jgi:hypothetical protein
MTGKRCAYRHGGSTNPHTQEREMPDKCRFAIHAKKEGHRNEIIKELAKDNEIIRIKKNILISLNKWHEVEECSARHKHECPFEAYMPDVEDKVGSD